MEDHIRLVGSELDFGIPGVSEIAIDLSLKSPEGSAAGLEFSDDMLTQEAAGARD
jgi:hypothetical protein